MSPFEKKVLRIVLYNPMNMIPLLKSLGNVNHAYSILAKSFPNRVGLEFETGSYVEFRIPIKRVPNKGIYLGSDEQTFSFIGFKQLVNLNYLLDLFKENTPFNTASGIHIHIDFTKRDERLWNPCNFPIHILDYLIKVFNYTGMYNERYVSFDKTAIRYHSGYHTIEYRILSMTYTFSTLVKWIMVCMYCTKCMENEVSISTTHIDEILSL